MATYAEYKNALYADRKLTSTQKAVASCIAHHADWKTGQHSHPGNDRIADETGYSKRAVISAVTELVNQGWLIQTYNGRGANSKKASEYSLSIPGMMTVVQSATDASQSATDTVQSATDDTSKCSTFTTSTSELPPNDLLSSTPASREEDEASQGKRGRKEAGHSLATTPGPTALGPTLPGSPATARSAHSGPAPTASLAPRSARTYVYWESRDVPGKFFVFPEDKALRAPKSAARVTLTVEEDEFYQRSFRGGVEVNEDRAWFLSASAEDRRELMEQTPQEVNREPAPEVQSVNAGKWYPAGKQTSQDRVPVWYWGGTSHYKNTVVYAEKPRYERRAHKVSIDRTEFNRLFGLAA